MSHIRFALIAALALSVAASGCVTGADFLEPSSTSAAGAAPPTEDVVLLDVSGDVSSAEGYSRTERVELPAGVTRARVDVDYALDSTSPWPDGVCINVGGVTDEERVFHLVFAGEAEGGGGWKDGVSEKGSGCSDRSDSYSFVANQRGGAIFAEARFEGYDGRFEVRVTALAAE